MAEYFAGAVKTVANVVSKSVFAGIAIKGTLITCQTARNVTGFALGTTNQVLKGKLIASKRY